MQIPEKVSMLNIITAMVVTAITSAGAAWGLSEKDASKMIAQLSTDLTQEKEGRLSAEKKVSELLPRLTFTLSELADLEEKYTRCTNVTGAVVISSPLDSDAHRSALTVGGSVELAMVSSAVYVTLVRITNSGAVLRIEGCSEVGAAEGVRSPDDGPRAFVVGLGEDLTFFASSSCCEHSLAFCDVFDLERIHFHVLEFDVDQQRAQLQWKRTLLGGAP